ncbi:fasciclin-like arabinogalactan family protein [Striga asiatica]|uniref:Fasciclin-like arabinogalactan family protein n=1 Tax=Striga asiatica TaxID=4170 RepID=A0A5A7QXV2_STRAF|nr:fasciclin-like arabinogalactan family protein [Striga asiatica]
MTLLAILIALLLVSSTKATNLTSDKEAATREMQKANYFTFVMLLNMAPPDIIKGGITFLMPNDKALSKAAISESSVADFLLRHSIPSPLLIDDLEHFPSESTVPASKPGLVFRVRNQGRRHFFLSNVRVVSPNICTEGLLVRCHGVDGVARPEMPNPPLGPPCHSNGSSPSGAVAPSTAWLGDQGPISTPWVVEASIARPKSGNVELVMCRGSKYNHSLHLLCMSSYGLRICH